MAERSIDELIAAADRAASGASSPSSGRKNYYWNKAKEGLAEGVGTVADVIPRALQLQKAAAGMIMSPFTNDLPQVDLGFANANTEALKSLFGVEQIAPESRGQELLGGVVKGAASLPLPIGKGGTLMELLKSVGVGGLAGGGATAGGQVAQSLAPESPTAQIAGPILGGLLGGVVVPSAGGLAGIYNRARQATEEIPDNPALQAAARTTAEKIVDRQVKDAVSGTPKAAQNITEALALREKFGPGFSPSVAEMADSPGLTEMQRRFTLTTPQRLNAEVARDAASVAAIKDFYSGAAPKQGAPGSIRSAVNQDIADRGADLAAKAESNALRVPVANQQGIGERASQIADAEKIAARPAITAAYEKAFEAAGNTKIDLAPVIAKTEEILGTRLANIKPETAPATVSAIARLGGTESEVAGATLKDFDAIRKAINMDVASAMRSSDPSAAMRMRNLSELHRTIDEAISTSAVPGTAKALYGAAIQKYRNEFVPRFKEGANLQMFKDTSLNEPRIMADKFTSSYFKPDAQGGVTRASQFSQLFGNNPEAKDLTRQGILDLYRQKVVNPQNGQIDVTAHNRFMRDHGRTIGAYEVAGVKVSDDIASVGKAAAELTAQQEKLTSIAKSMKFDTTDDLITAALGSPKVMGNTLMRLPGPQRENLQRALMDKAWESGTGAGMQKYLQDNAKTLRMALSDRHITDLTDIAKGIAITERAPVRGVLASGGPDVLKNATGVSLATVWSQWRATSGGRQGPATAVFNLAAPVMTKLSQTNFNDIMQKALHDPETAKALRNFLMASSPQGAEITAKGLLSRIGDTVKMGAGIVWDYKGNAAKLLSGYETYPLNAARAAIPIATEQDLVR